MGRLREYFHYMTTKGCTKAWMDVNFSYYTPTHEDEKLKRELTRNIGKEEKKIEKVDIFGE